MTFLNLDPRFTLGDLDVTEYPFAVNQDGIDFQTGDLVTSVLSSFLLDGDIEVSQRRGNMTLAIPILIEGSDLAVLADSLKALAYESEKQKNTLAIDPGDGFGAVTVFETFRGNLDYTYNAKAEQNGFRQYTLTMRALPFGRSATSVVAVALPASGSTRVLVNDASSTSGWSGSFDGIAATVIASSGPPTEVAIAALGAASAGTLILTSTFSTATTKYLEIDWRPPAGIAASLTASADGVALDQVAQAPLSLTDSKRLRTTFLIPASVVSVNVLTLTAAQTGAALPSLGVDNVGRSDYRPVLGTARQQARAIPINGSARATGAIVIASPSSSLGDVLVYTSPDDGTGYVPPLRNFKTSAQTPTASVTAASGFTNTLDADLVYDVPVGYLPNGLYALVARVSNQSVSAYASSINWTASARIGSTTVGRVVPGSAPVSLQPAVSAGFSLVPLGYVNLPTLGFRSSSVAMQRFTFRDANSSSANLAVDEIYACNLTTGRLSMFRCGSGSPTPGGPSRRAWIAAADLTSRTPQIMRGHSADGSDAFYVADNILAPGVHEMTPPRARVFLMTGDALDAEVSFEHFPRWLGHAAS